MSMMRNLKSTIIVIHGSEFWASFCEIFHLYNLSQMTIECAHILRVVHQKSKHYLFIFGVNFGSLVNALLMLTLCSLDA